MIPGARTKDASVLTQAASRVYVQLNVGIFPLDSPGWFAIIGSSILPIFQPTPTLSLPGVHRYEMKIQLAFQGGGAKLSALLAAVEEIKTLQADESLNVTRVAGTSAGAIAACLLAGDISIPIVKAYLTGGIGKQLVSYFPSPGLRKLYLLGIHGRPFWDTGLLARHLGKLFADQNLFTIADLEKKGCMEVLIVSTDLRDSQKITAPKESNIVSALMDSCGLPFCFRTWGNSDGPVIVDGGLCENLPIGELQLQDDDGPIVAISFKQTRTSAPSNLTEFSIALLNAAINNSMHRARSALSPDCVFEIDSSIGTFDFERSLTDGLGAAYDLVKYQTREFFDGFIKTRRTPQTVVLGDPWTEKNLRAVESMRGIGEVYFAQHAKETFRYLDCVLEVTANSLLPQDETEMRQPDRMKYSALFHPLDKPIQCMSVALMSSADGFLGKTSWDLRDENKNPISSIALPALNDKSPLDRELVYFFNPVLEPGRGNFRVVFKDEAFGLMEKFRKTSEDDLIIFPRRARGAVDRIRIVLHIPNNFPNVEMIAKPGDSRGRRMKDQELAEFDNCPAGFYSRGWIGEKIEGTSFGPDLRIRLV